MKARATWWGRRMKYRTVVQTFLVLCIAASPAVRAAEFETPTAIIHGTVIPKAGESIEDGTVVIDDGRIIAVGSGVAIPDTAEIVDATGLWVYPGFIDAASHIGISADVPDSEEIARLSDVEQDVVQGPRTHMQQANRRGIWPHRTVSDLYVADDKGLDAYRKNGFTTALVSPHPAILGGQGDVLQLSGGHLRRAVLASGVTQIVSFRASATRESFFNRRYPGAAMGAVALLRQTYMDGEWYRSSHSLFARHPNKLERPPTDPVMDAVVGLIDHAQTWIFVANTSNEIHHALDLAEEFKQSIIILGGKEAWKVAARLADEEVAVIVSPDWEKKPKLAPKKKKSEDDAEDAHGFRTTESWYAEWEDDFFEPLAVREERVRQWQEQVNNARVLVEAGVQIAFTSRDLEKKKDLWKNLRTAMGEGLAEDDVLRALTKSPADLFGLDEQIGEIALGKVANLALTTHPIADEKSQVRFTFIDGQRFTYAVKNPDVEEQDENEEDEGDESAEDDEEDSGDDSEDEGDASEEPVDNHPWETEFEADRVPPIHTGGDVLLTNASVLTVTQGTFHEADVLILDGRIQAVGHDLEAPDDVRVIDLRGYWIMPGIVDPHSHMAIAGGINEATQSITSEVRVTDVVDDTQLAIHRALAGGVTTIHAMHGSANAMGGQNAVVKLKRNTSPAQILVTSGPRIVKFALGENPTRSGRSGRRFPGTRMGVESVMRQGFSDALTYRAERKDYAERTAAGEIVELPRRDLRLEALSDIIEGNIWVHSHCYRADEMLRLLAVAEDYGFRIATLQHVLEGYRVAPEMFRHGVGGSTFSDWWGYKKEAFDAIPFNAAMMAKAGIVASLNSDSADVVRYLNLEAAKTLRYGGLNADEALKLITINPARQIGLENRIGSIERGKDGDLAVFNRHPLDTFGRCVMTFIEGEVYFVHPDMNAEAIAPGPGSDFIPEPPRGLLDVPSNAEGFYAIVGATVHPISSDPIPDGVVVIKNGIITAVSERMTPPQDATVIEAQGLHVYPGLINAVSQVGLLEINSQSETNDTREIAQFQPDIQTISAVNPFSTHVGVTLCEGITTTGVFPSGGPIAGRAGLIQLKGWSMPEMLREAELGLVIDLPSLRANLEGEDRKKQIEDHREAIEALEDYVRKAQHYAAVGGPEAGVARDIRLDAMRPYVTGEKPVFFRANRYKEILEAIRFSEVFELKPIIVGGADAWKCADTLAEKEIPVIVTRIYSTVPNPYEAFDANYANPAVLEDAGVSFCIATDGSAYAKRLPVHAGMAVAHGLSEDKAIRSITLDAARILGVADDLGSLEVAKVADVIITTGNPCQANTRTVATFLAGKPVELTSLHERSYQKWTERPAPEATPEKALRGPSPMRDTSD